MSAIRLTRIKIYTFIFHSKYQLSQNSSGETLLDSSIYDKGPHVSIYYAVKQSSFIKVIPCMDPRTKK